jgi:hypothetical protein
MTAVVVGSLSSGLLITLTTNSCSGPSGSM